MISLAEFHDIRMKQYPFPGSPGHLEDRGNGVGCPACLGELHDTGPVAGLKSYPPRTGVLCKQCGWKGHRIL